MAPVTDVTVVSRRRAGNLIVSLLGLAAALAFIIADTRGRVAHLRAVRAHEDIHVESPKFSPQEATGYALGERMLVLPATTVDSYHEIMQAQQMLAGGPWRVRHVAYDNSPNGREVHWAFPMRGWLALVAWTQHALTGQPLGAAVEDAALVANPLLLALFLLFSVPWICRHFGPMAGALLAGGAVCWYPFFLNFTGGNAEHQGMAEALAFTTVAFLLVGMANADRRAFIGSGVCGGAGLWISAASEAPVLLGIGFGVGLALWQVRDRSRRAVPTVIVPAEYWRFWGLTGGGVSLAAYLLEYFPSHFGWRFEVNHPVYALAWAAGGEGLCHFSRWRSASLLERRKREGRIALLAGATIAGIAAGIIVTRNATFWISDPFLWHLHADYIGEFQSLRSYVARRGFDLAMISGIMPFVLPVAALGVGLVRRNDDSLRSQLPVALAPAVVAVALALLQIRWWGLACGLCVASALPCLAGRRQQSAAGPRARVYWTILWVAVLVPGGIVSARSLSLNAAYSTEEIESLAERDLAHWLRASWQPPITVLSTPNLTTGLIFHGGVAGVGTLYWENREGLETAATIFAARTAGEARKWIEAAGVTHIVVASWDPFLGNYIRLARGQAPSARPEAPYFAACLVGQAALPPWLHRLPFSLPPHPALRGQWVLVFAVDLESR